MLIPLFSIPKIFHYLKWRGAQILLRPMKKLFIFFVFLFLTSTSLLQAQKAHSLYGWGLNDRGQLGDGVVLKYAPHQNKSEWKTDDAGSYHTLAIKADGTLWAWGRNYHGQLGDGTWKDSSNPVKLSASNDWAVVAAGGAHSMAIKEDGTLWAWGNNVNGQLGDGTFLDKNVPVRVGSDTDWVYVTAGGEYSLGIKEDGTLWAWGNNSHGELGDGTNRNRNAPAQIGSADDWNLVTAGDFHALAIKKDGTLWSWGRNYDGQLGISSTNDSSVPVQVNTSTDWNFASAGGNHSLAIKADGSLWAWGQNAWGQIGDGTLYNTKDSPVKIGTGWYSVSAGWEHSVGVKTDGTNWAWGGNSKGQLGDGTTINRYVPVQLEGVAKFELLSAGGYHTIGILADGSLWAWGTNNFGQLGDGVMLKYEPHQSGNAKNWQLVSAGWEHAIAIKSDGTLWSWGHNFDGQLGDGTNNDRGEARQIGTDSNWASLAAGWNHNLALKEDGTLWTWGNNAHGQLGNGATRNGYVPVQIGKETDWVAIAAGESFSLAVKSDGTLWTWGANYFGQLGTGTTGNSYTPTQVEKAKDWASVAAGARYSLAIKKDGTLWAWGSNENGQLGDGTTTERPAPVQVGIEADWSAVSGGWDHTMAVKKDGTLWGWGSGPIGNGMYKSPNPAQIGSDTDWSLISTGWDHTVGLKTDGTLWAWGYNFFGMVGDGTTREKYAPTQIGRENNWKSISSGGLFTLAIFAEDITVLPSLTKPRQGSHSNQSIAVEFSLPEAAQAGSVQLSFTRTGGAEDPKAPHIIILDGSFETAGEQSLILNGRELGASPGVAAVNSDQNNGLVDGAVYTVGLSYQDVEGNAPGRDENTDFTYDETAPALLIKSASLELNEAGTASLTVADIDAGTTDNVSQFADLNFAFGQETFNCTEIDVHLVEVRVTDQAGNTSLALAEVTVADAAAPSIVAGQEFILDENAAAESLVGKVSASDNCGISSWRISSGNTADAFTIDAEGAVKVYNEVVLDYENLQEFLLEVEVTDVAGNAETESISVKLNDVNDNAPVLVDISALSGHELDEISFTATATDPDAAAVLIYSLEHAPAGASINASTGEFSWIPTEEQGPHSYTFSVIVSDGAFSDTKKVTLTVEEVNEAPVITSEAITSAKEGAAYAYQLVATDADLPENTLTYEALEMPSWLSFDVATQLLSGTPGRDAEESSPIRLQVSDGQESVVQEFTLTVEILTGIFDRTAEQPQDIQIYPNPTQGTITLHVGDALAGEQVGISLLDLSGRELLQQKGSLEKSMKEVNAYLQQAKAGIYLLQLERKEKVVQLKVVKE